MFFWQECHRRNTCPSRYVSGSIWCHFIPIPMIITLMIGLMCCTLDLSTVKFIFVSFVINKYFDTMSIWCSSSKLLARIDNSWLNQLHYDTTTQWSSNSSFLLHLFVDILLQGRAIPSLLFIHSFTYTSLDSQIPILLSGFDLLLFSLVSDTQTLLDLSIWSLFNLVPGCF